MFTRCLHELFGIPVSRAEHRAAGRRASYRPSLEALEDRMLLNAGMPDPTFSDSGVVVAT